MIDVARHEYAHAVAKLRFPKENHGHDSVWRGICHEVGAPDTTKYSCDGLGDAIKKRREQSAKYVVECRSCGHRAFYRRKDNVVVDSFIHPRRYMGFCKCPKCSSTHLALLVRGKKTR